MQQSRTFKQMEREAIGRVQRAVQISLETGCTAEEVLRYCCSDLEVQSRNVTGRTWLQSGRPEEAGQPDLI